MMSIFVFGTLWFWLLLSLSVILMIVFIEKEEQTGTGATITLLAFIGLTCFLGNQTFFMNLLNYVATNPGTIILTVLGYYLLGVVWSFVKWYFYLNDLRVQYKEGKKTMRQDDISFLENKSRILVWMSYWPFSAIWTAINDPIKRGFQYLQSKLSGTYQKMSDRMFKDFNVKK